MTRPTPGKGEHLPYLHPHSCSGSQTNTTNRSTTFCGRLPCLPHGKSQYLPSLVTVRHTLWSNLAPSRSCGGWPRHARDTPHKPTCSYIYIYIYVHHHIRAAVIYLPSLRVTHRFQAGKKQNHCNFQRTTRLSLRDADFKPFSQHAPPSWRHAPAPPRPQIALTLMESWCFPLAVCFQNSSWLIPTRTNLQANEFACNVSQGSSSGRR